MFVQARIVYIVEKHAGLSSLYKDLSSKGLLNVFFNKEVSENDKIFNKFLKTLPEGTVFCIPVEYGKSTSSKSYYKIALPFLSSHYKFPIKIGEIVWYYEYSINSSSTTKYTTSGYYLGRVHSLSGTEDTAYCFSDREFTYLNIEKNDIFDEFSSLSQKNKTGSLQLLDLKQKLEDTNNTVYDPSTFFISNYSKDLLNGKNFDSEIRLLGLKPQPGIKNHCEDVVLKGSYNATFKLTKTIKKSLQNYNEKDDNFSNNGKVEIIAGEKNNVKRKSKEVKKLYAVLNDEGKSTPEFKEVTFFGNNILPEISNSIFFEKIKTEFSFPNFSSIDSNVKKIFNKMYNNDFTADMSKIIVSEDCYEDNFIKNKFKNSMLDLKTSYVKYSKPSLLHEKSPKKLDLECFLNESLILKKLNDNEESSIIGLSDNITFVTHENDTNSGEISLIKPNSQDGKSSFLCLTKSGNLTFDANKILIGNYDRLQSKENGKSALVYLGYTKDMQSLVLGERLQEFLIEILDVQRETMDKTKDLFNKVKETKKKINENTKSELRDNLIKIQASTSGEVLKATNPYIAPPLAAAPLKGSDAAALINLAFTNYTKQLVNDLKDNIDAMVDKNNEEIKKLETDIKNTLFKRDEELSSRLLQIENNISQILSKFTKTSWDSLKDHNYI